MLRFPHGISIPQLSACSTRKGKHHHPASNIHGVAVSEGLAAGNISGLAGGLARPEHAAALGILRSHHTTAVDKNEHELAVLWRTTIPMAFKRAVLATPAAAATAAAAAAAVCGGR